MKVKATINRITDKPESTVKAYASVSLTERLQYTE